jgi:hypothetical protein
MNILFVLSVFVVSPLASHEPHAYEHTDNTDQKMGNNQEIHAEVLSCRGYQVVH